MQVYDLDRATWTKLPPSPQYWCEAAAVNNELVLIGGVDSLLHTITNMVSTWTEQGWQQKLQALPTRRLRPGVVTYGTYLIVAGGKAEDNQTLLSSIDVLDTTTQQWQTPANLQLPRPMYEVEITMCATDMYVGCAHVAYNATTNTYQSSKSAWQLQVNTLAEVLTQEDNNLLQWTEIPPTPSYGSALLQHTAHPLAIGGRDSSYNSTSNIAIYNFRSNKWSTVGQLLQPRVRCSVVGLTKCSFLVLGGRSDVADQNTLGLLCSAEMVTVQ